MRKKMYDFTDLTVNQFLKSVDDYCLNPKNDISEVYISFREFETKCLKALQERFYKKYPYNYNEKMTHSTDVSARKIRYLTNKK